MNNKRKILIISLIFLALGIILNISNKTYASEDLDEIENYTITVDPDMNNGALDIIYEISWKVLDSTTEGPLTWVSIGTPNEYYSNLKPLTPNIEKLEQAGSYVNIYFTQAYKEGDIVTFKYSIHQEYMYNLKGKKCIYEFTPAWFTNIKVKNIKIKWNKDNVKKADNNSEEGNYYVWSKTNLDKGEKLKAKIQYKKSAFAYLNKMKQASGNTMSSFSLIMVVIFFVLIIYLSMSIGGGGYYGHRGFYCGPYYGGFHIRRTSWRLSRWRTS